MQIYGPAHVHGPQGINAPHSPRSTQGSQPQRTQAADQVDISPEAAAASSAGDVRAELVDRIKSEIASGSYETPEKLDLALDRLLDDIA